MSRMLKQSVPLRSGPSGLASTQHWMRRRWRGLTGAGVLAAGVLVWVLWPTSPQRYSSDPRSRPFSSFTVCMLTGSRGVDDPLAASVWGGIEDAAKTVGVQGSYLSVPQPDTQGAAEVYVNTLASRHCSLVVATGASEAAAVSARAAVYTSQRFVVVGAGRSAANVRIIPDATATVRAAVAAVVEEAVAGHFG